jgi:hypothetical protein
MIYIECPDKYYNPSRSNHSIKSKSIVIAGGITDCYDWQEEIVQKLKNEKIIIYNPRRSNCPNKPANINGQVNNNNQSNNQRNNRQYQNILEEQIKWEYEYLKQSDATSFWFPPETLCPITLFELGKQLMSKKRVFVGIHPEYARKEDVEIQIKLVRPEIKVVDNLDLLSEQIKGWAKK